MAETRLIDDYAFGDLTNALRDRGEVMRLVLDDGYVVAAECHYETPFDFGVAFPVPGGEIVVGFSRPTRASALGLDVDRFLTLHRLSKVGKARFMDERMERFFRSVTARLAAAGWAQLWFLEHEGAAVAAFLCLEYGGRVGLYNSGFDPARAQLAPGIVLLAHVIRDAIERGVPIFDFLRGEEPYKYGFGPSPEDVLNIKVSP